MAKSRLATEWDRTAAVLAMIANAKRNWHRPLVRPDRMNPFRKPPRESIAQAMQSIGPKDPSQYLPVSTLVTPPEPANN
jgi:hypothetical protein